MTRGTRRQPGRRPAARLGRWVVGLGLVATASGCGIAPRNFRSLVHPAPIVRARSVALGEGLTDDRVVPALIQRLGDTDPVVRLTAHEELRRRSGQDFGYVPWASPEERRQAAGRWEGWWRGRQAGLARSRRIP